MKFVLDIDESKISPDRLKFMIQQFKRFDLDLEITVEQYKELSTAFALKFSSKPLEHEKLVFKDTNGGLLIMEAKPNSGGRRKW